MKRKTARRGLGIYADGKKVYLFYCSPGKKNLFINVDISQDGFSFKKFPRQLIIKDKKNRNLEIAKLTWLRFSNINNKYLLAYRTGLKRSVELNFAYSYDLLNWQKVNNLSNLKAEGMVVPELKYQKQYVLYYADSALKLAYSSDLEKWESQKKLLLKTPAGYQKTFLKIGGVALTCKGILVTFLLKGECNNFPLYGVWAALFDQKEPSRLLWVTPAPIWQLPEELAAAKAVNFLGTIVFKGKILSYWEIGTKGIFNVPLISLDQLLEQKFPSSPLFLKKISENPILKPILDHYWESKAVFNPAALYEKGKVHLVYRAIGDNDTSVLGYAASSDGVHIDTRLPQPIFMSKKPFGRLGHTVHHSSPFMSGGGGYGGCEDPRLTRIGDTIYMTFVAYDGGSPPRIALTSIKASDFLAHEWRWQEPVLISPPGVVDKNACLLPEKVQNKYVIFHRIYPNILVDFVDDLSFDGKTKWLRGDAVISPRPTFWDSRKVGAGPPPLKTKDGWLLIYHAVGDQDPSRYKMGAMLLDLQHPDSVLYRSDQPILEPTALYENEGWKSGVVYPCGAVTKKDQLLVYYGGADMVVCAAKAKLNEFTNQLKNTGTARLYALN